MKSGPAAAPGHRPELPTVGIVGAGISGAALALALTEAGVPVVVYEQTSVEQASADPVSADRGSADRGFADRGFGGAGDSSLLELTASGTRVLHALGVQDALADLALEPEFVVTRAARTAITIATRPLGAFYRSRYGAPFYLAPAGALTNLLRSALAARGISLETGAAVHSVDAETATLALTSGQRHAHGAVVLATGSPVAHSPVLDGLAAMTDAALAAPLRLRIRTQRPDPDRSHGRFLTTWLGDGFAVLERPAKERDGLQPVELTVLIAAERFPASRELSSQAPDKAPNKMPDELLAELKSHLAPSLHPALAALIDAGTAELLSATAPAPAERWHAGRTAALGGLVHGLDPDSPWAASAALEDAWVLSRMIERWDDEPHGGFNDYERYRRPRAERLSAHAAAEIAALTLTGALPVWQRNLKLGLLSRFLPEIGMQRLDWLHGYDCIRGFH